MSKIVINVTAGSEVSSIVSDSEEVLAAVQVAGSDELTSVAVEYKPEVIGEIEQRFSFTSADL